MMRVQKTTYGKLSSHNRNGSERVTYKSSAHADKDELESEKLHSVNEIRPSFPAVHVERPPLIIVVGVSYSQAPYRQTADLYARGLI